MKMNNGVYQNIDLLIFRSVVEMSEYMEDVANSGIFKKHGGRAPLVLNDPSTGIEILITGIVYLNFEPVFVYDYAHEYKNFPRKDQFLAISDFLEICKLYENLKLRLVYKDMAEALTTNEYIANFPPSTIGLN